MFIFLYRCYICYPLASYMGYPPKGYFTSFGCSGIATSGASGHSFFSPDYMGNDLVLGLIVIRVAGFSLLGCMLLCIGQLEFITIVSTHRNK